MLPIHFSPLQGYTEDAYRRIHHALYGGVDMYYTPFIRTEPGIDKLTNRRKVRSKDLRDIRPEYNAGVPVTPQVMVADGQELDDLLQVILPFDYPSVDINMGCPFPLQTRHGKGAGILAHPDKVKEVCKVIEAYPEVNFSVKMRLGLDTKEQWRDVLPILNDTPLHHVTLHPRIATQQYKGEVDMPSFELFLQECRHPLIYNGDIRTAEDILRIEHDYPTLNRAGSPQVAGIMIGRGLLANPSLAVEYRSGEAWDADRRLQTLFELHSRLLEHYTKVIPGEAQRLQKIRTFWDYLEPEEGCPSLLDRKQWKKIKKAGNMANYLKVVPPHLNKE